MSFTVDSLWKELQIRFALFLKWVGVCTMDPESKVANLEPLCCEEGVAEIELPRMALKIDAKLRAPYKCARETAHSKLIPTRRCDGDAVLAALDRGDIV